MGYTTEQEPTYYRRAREDPEPSGDEPAAESVWSTLLVERSADLQTIDPGGRLRVACVEALDRRRVIDRLDVLPFGWGWIEFREIERGHAAAPHVAAGMRDLPDHVRVDFARVLGQMAHWSDGPEFFVLLASPYLEIARPLLYADIDEGPVDAHWRSVPITKPELSTPPPRDTEFGMGDGGYLRPGGRLDACFVIASIGGEPSAELRHLAELSGGAVVAVYDDADADAFGDACAARFEAVCDALDRRVHEAERWHAEWERKHGTA